MGHYPEIYIFLSFKKKNPTNIIISSNPPEEFGQTHTVHQDGPNKQVFGRVLQLFLPLNYLSLITCACINNENKTPKNLLKLSSYISSSLRITELLQLCSWQSFSDLKMYPNTTFPLQTYILSVPQSIYRIY